MRAAPHLPWPRASRSRGGAIRPHPRAPILAISVVPSLAQALLRSVSVGTWAFESAHLDDLVQALRTDGYRVIGPRVRDGAIVYDEITSAAELPRGVADEQAPGRYRLRVRSDGAFFGYAAGANSAKPLFLRPEERLWRARWEGGGFTVLPEPEESPRVALFGVRACDLAAIAVQDTVLMNGPVRDPRYAARRESVFVVAVQCTDPAGTCFCASMETGPAVRRGFDLALTEILSPSEHRFLAEDGSDAGASLMERLGFGPAADEDRRAAAEAIERARTSMQRALDTRGIRQLLYESALHPRWQEVASRCLGCANCTLVCPTCFCTTVEDMTDLGGSEAARVRRWDSCFTLAFSHIHGGPVRRTLAARYRQWLTHKLASWIDQFGTSGCVGCGRCITWCPVGIDLTQEVAALRHPPERRHGEPGKAA